MGNLAPGFNSLPTLAYSHLVSGVAAGATLASGLTLLTEFFQNNEQYAVIVRKLEIVLATATASALALYMKDTHANANGKYKAGVLTAYGNYPGTQLSGAGAGQEYSGVVTDAAVIGAAPTDAIKNVIFPATVGSRILWEWDTEDNPLILTPNSALGGFEGLLLKNVGGGVCGDVYVNYEWSVSACIFPNS